MSKRSAHPVAVATAVVAATTLALAAPSAVAATPPVNGTMPPGGWAPGSGSWSPVPRMMVLSTPAGTASSEPTGMSKNGIIVGYAHSHGTPGTDAAIRWGGDLSATVLAVLPGDTDDQALGVNEVGTVIGVSWQQSVSHAVRWADNGTATALAPLGLDTNSRAIAISSTGTAVGQSWSDPERQNAVAWTPDGTAVALEPLDGDVDTTVTGINASGTAVGYSVGTEPGAPRHAVIWGPDGIPTALAAPAGWVETQAYQINDAGVVTGYGRPDLDPYTNRHGLVWNTDGSVADLGFPAVVAAVNSAGTVAGTAGSNDVPYGFAATWRPDGTMTAIGPNAANSPNTAATSINDSGVAVGYSWFGNPSREERTAMRWNPDGTTTVLSDPSAATAMFVCNVDKIAGVQLIHDPITRYAHHVAVEWRP